MSNPDDILRAARRHFGIADRKLLASPPSLSVADIEARNRIATPEARSPLLGSGRELEHQISEEISRIDQEISRLQGVKANLELQRFNAERARLGGAPQPGDVWT